MESMTFNRAPKAEREEGSVYIDATSLGAADRRFEAEVIRLIRAAMHPFEMQLERIQVQVSSNQEGHVCRLHAWAQRGQTVVIESRSTSRLSAIETATERLTHAIAKRSGRGLVASVASPHLELLTSDSSVQASLAPASKAQRAAVDQKRSVLRPRVLLALRELDPSNASLQWARVLADALQADLDVCRVLPETPATEGAPAGRAWLETTRRLLAATRETRRWCADALPNAALSERLIPGAANIVEEAALRARERGVDWIVMPDVHDGCGRSATALARASGCPVLVARAPTSRSTLLLATDVSEDLYPISSRAAALAEALHAPVLAFHDVGFRVPELSSRVNALTDAWAQIQLERLAGGGHQRLPELEVLLAHGTDRVETILQQARREDAEIIIVGLSEGADAETDLAAEVVDHAIRSVLVVPSTVARAAIRRRHPADDAKRSRRSSAGMAIERRRCPRAGSRAPHSNERRRWRAG
jgi:nucleotide-binding universal stress UspA family protein